jgi:hypothetical protein
MIFLRKPTVASIALCSGLLTAAPAAAGPLDWLFPDDYGCHCYPASRYWFPSLAHCHDSKDGPKLSVCPPNRHPEIPPYCLVLKYPCPAPPPAQTIITPPAPGR